MCSGKIADGNYRSAEDFQEEINKGNGLAESLECELEYSVVCVLSFCILILNPTEVNGVFYHFGVKKMTDQ